MTLAQERAEASERRALRELDAERTARQQRERTAEALCGELVAARSEARARLEAQAAALADRLANAAGQRWDGTGEMPDWLQRAVNAGQSVEFFKVG